MSVYIVFGLLVSAILIGYIWLANVEASENLKIFASLALVVGGWAVWPGLLIAGFMLLMKNLSQKRRAAE